MRKMVVVRGPQGSGKSTILADAGLADHALSADRMRLAMGGPVLSNHGRMMMPQHRNAHVWDAVLSSLDARMAYAETIAFEATLPTWKDMNNLLQRARRYRYEVLVIDLYDIEPAVVLAQNAPRTGIVQTSPTSVAKTITEWERSEVEIAAFQAGGHQGNHALKDYVAAMRDIHPLRWADRTGFSRAIADFLRVDVLDLSHYEEILHVGDIQGCADAAFGEGSPFEHGLDPARFHVFVGDALDRGIQNGRVMRWILDHAVHLDNVAFLRGNHEDHLLRYEDGEPSAAREFNFRTAPQLMEAGIGPSDVATYTQRLVDVLPYMHRGTRVLVSHAGLPIWPDRLELVPGQQCVTGTGNYSDPVDRHFSEWSIAREASTGIAHWQIHGHRNREMLPVLADQRSFNLEGQPDFGGHVRFVSLRDGRFTPIEIRNRAFRGVKEWRDINMAESRKEHGPAAPLAPWVLRGDPLEPAMDPAEVEAFRSHDFVAERRSTTLPHVSAMAFTKAAFHDKMWDSVTTQARGAFIDTVLLHFVNRGYRKFFNWGERADTTTDALRETLVAPFRAYEKENGFLGLAGYDRRTDSLILSSKSMIEGEFAEMFREIAREQLGDAGLERLYRVLRDQGATAAFEVIDPVRDPHIVAYEERGLVLLDIIRRSKDDETMPYDDLVKTAAYIGVPVKKAAFTIPNFDALLKKITPAMEDVSWRWHGREIEGLVIQDAAGRIVKVKTASYSFWKWMRSIKDRIVHCRRTGRPFGRKVEDERAIAFMAFCERQPTDVLERDIIYLRSAYQADPEAVLPSEMPETAPVEEKRDMTGFLRGVTAVAEQIRKGTGKAESIRRMLEQAEVDPDKAAAFATHPDRDLIREAGAVEA